MLYFGMIDEKLLETERYFLRDRFYIKAEKKELTNLVWKQGLIKATSVWMSIYST